MRRLLIATACCAWIGASFAASAALWIATVAKKPELMLCPAPIVMTQVRCPAPHEITTSSISCMQKVRADECALVAQGEVK